MISPKLREEVQRMERWMMLVSKIGLLIVFLCLIALAVKSWW